MKSFTHRSALLLAVGVLLLATSAHSQVNWWRTDNRSVVTLELHKLDYNTGTWGNNYGFWNVVGFLGGEICLSPRFSIIAETPFSKFQTESHIRPLAEPSYPSGVSSQSSLGNPYLGLDMRSNTSDAVLHLGLRFPLASEERLGATSAGRNGAYDRFEAFVPNLWSVSMHGGYCTVPRDRGISAYFVAGFVGMFPNHGRADFFPDYAGSIGAVGKNIRLAISLHGRYLTPNNNTTFSDEFIHEVGILAGLRFRNVEPSVHFRIPLHYNIRRIIQFTYGLTLQIDLPPRGTV